MADTFVYQSVPHVGLGANTFIDVPVILKFDDTPLISMAKEERLGYTTEFAIFHSDGAFLAKVVGTRICPAEAGVKAGIKVEQQPGRLVCTRGRQTVFEIAHKPADALRVQAELYTPAGYFVKYSSSPVPLIRDARGAAIKVLALTMSDCIFSSLKVGIWVKRDGSIAFGSNA